jgi:hypothetical protein
MAVTSRLKADLKRSCMTCGPKSLQNHIHVHVSRTVETRYLLIFGKKYPGMILLKKTFSKNYNENSLCLKIEHKPFESNLTEII